MRKIALCILWMGALVTPLCHAETLSLSLNDFLVEDPGTAIHYDSSSGMAYAEQYDAGLVGKLDLPDGAIITSASFHGYDAHTIGFEVFNAHLRWRELASGTLAGPYGQVYAAAPGTFSIPMGGDLPHEVDKSTYAYYATVNWLGCSGDADTAFSCITIEYTPPIGAVMPALSFGSLLFLAGGLGGLMAWYRRRRGR